MNKFFRRIFGTRGHGDPEDTSQKTEDRRNGDGDNGEGGAGQHGLGGRTGSLESVKGGEIKPGVENSRSTAWRTG